MRRKKKKTQKKKKEKKDLESRYSLRKGSHCVSCFLVSVISASKSPENISKYVSRWALVAAWGHLPRHEGAWGAVWVCWRLLGGQDGSSRGLNSNVLKIRIATWSPQKREMSPQEAPKSIKNEAKRAQNTLRSIFRSQTLIFQKSSSCRSEIKVFEGGRDSLGAQNRQEEAPREGKQRLERRWRKNKRTKTYTYGTDKVQQRSFLLKKTPRVS